MLKSCRCLACRNARRHSRGKSKLVTLEARAFRRNAKLALRQGREPEDRVSVGFRA